MLRISQSGHRTVSTLAIDGKLVGPWVEELRRAVEAHRPQESVCLDLEHLAFADDAGLSLLRLLQHEGVQFVHVSPLMQGLLAASPAPAREPCCAHTHG